MGKSARATDKAREDVASPSPMDYAISQLVDYQNRLEMAIAGAELGLWDANLITGDVRFNRHWAAMLGYQPDELEPSIDQWKALVHPNDLELALANLEAHIAGEQETFTADIRMRTKDSQWKWVHTKGKVFERDNDGTPVRAVGIHQDISERKALEHQLKTMSLAIEKSPAATVVTTPEPRILYVNKSFTRISGYQPDEVIGKNPRILQSGKTPRRVYKQMWDKLIAKKLWTGELWNKNKDGDLRLEQVSISPVTDSDGEIINFIAVKQDITDKREMEDKIWRQANFDDLTGLCNRKYFFERTQISLTRARRQHKQLLLLYIDLDEFKPINDTFGHAAGDQVLREFSQRLNRHVRRSDVAARLGGDEFALVIEDFPADADIKGFIETIHTTVIAPPFEFDLTQRSTTHHPQIGATIGWAVYPADGDELEALLETADRRMYAAKHH